MLVLIASCLVADSPNKQSLLITAYWVLTISHAPLGGQVRQSNHHWTGKGRHWQSQHSHGTTRSHELLGGSLGKKKSFLDVFMSYFPQNFIPCQYSEEGQAQDFSGL